MYELVGKCIAFLTFPKNCQLLLDLKDLIQTRWLRKKHRIWEKEITRAKKCSVFEQVCLHVTMRLNSHGGVRFSFFPLQSKISSAAAFVQEGEKGRLSTNVYFSWSFWSLGFRGTNRRHANNSLKSGLQAITLKRDVNKPFRKLKTFDSREKLQMAWRGRRDWSFRRWYSEVRGASAYSYSQKIRGQYISTNNFCRLASSSIYRVVKLRIKKFRQVSGEAQKNGKASKLWSSVVSCPGSESVVWEREREGGRGRVRGRSGRGGGESAVKTHPAILFFNTRESILKLGWQIETLRHLYNWGNTYVFSLLSNPKKSIYYYLNLNVSQ